METSEQVEFAKIPMSQAAEFMIEIENFMEENLTFGEKLTRANLEYLQIHF